MSARLKELNLLPKEIWERGFFGQLLRWIISSGRYVVVFTELIVISAFLYRFGLDKTLLEIQKSILNKQQLITSYGDLEPNFLLIQKRLNIIKDTSGHQLIPSSLDLLSQMVPAESVLSSVSVNNKNIVIEGKVNSQTGLATLLNQAQAKDQFKEVVLENVKSGIGDVSAIEFRLLLTLKPL